VGLLSHVIVIGDGFAKLPGAMFHFLAPTPLKIASIEDTDKFLRRIA
jgi:hypothetical protein